MMALSAARAVLLIAILLGSTLECVSCARKLLDVGAGAATTTPASQPTQALQQPAELLESYACIASGVMRHPCQVNPGTIFRPGFSALNSSNVADRAYQTILAQHVLCRLHDSQASCQANTTAAMYCSWDSFRGRCVPDPYASLMLPLSCPGSKLHAMMRCGRASVMGGCASDPACTTGAQGRCYPRWLVDEAKQGGKDEQSIAEAAAVAILEGDADMLGSCPEAQLLRRLLQRCPWQATWEGCDLSVCEFATPHFVPLRPQSLRLPNVTAPAAAANSSSSGGSVLPTAPPSSSSSSQLMATEAAMQARHGSGNASDAPASGAALGGRDANTTTTNTTMSSSSGNTTGLQYYDAYPSPVCFVDASKVPMQLHTLLGVSPGLEAALRAAQAGCEATEDVFMDVGLGVEACGYEKLSFDLASPLRVAGVPRKQGPPDQQQQQQQQPEQQLKEPKQQQQQQQQQQPEQQHQAPPPPSPGGGGGLGLPQHPSKLPPRVSHITTEALNV